MNEWREFVSGVWLLMSQSAWKQAANRAFSYTRPRRDHYRRTNAISQSLRTLWQWQRKRKSAPHSSPSHASIRREGKRRSKNAKDLTQHKAIIVIGEWRRKKGGAASHSASQPAAGSQLGCCRDLWCRALVLLVLRRQIDTRSAPPRSLSLCILWRSKRRNHRQPGSVARSPQGGPLTRPASPHAFALDYFCASAPPSERLLMLRSRSGSRHRCLDATCHPVLRPFESAAWQRRPSRPRCLQLLSQWPVQSICETSRHK